MRSGIVLFIVAYIVWMLLSWPPDTQHALAGIPIAALVAYLAGGLFVQRPGLAFHVTRYFYLIFFYVPVLAWECLKANIDVALRVLNPSLPIRPGIVGLRTHLKSETGLTFLANSITLTPGTLTVDLDRDAGLLYVHCLALPGEDREALTRQIVGRFEPILKRVFE